MNGAAAHYDDDADGDDDAAADYDDALSTKKLVEQKTKMVVISGTAQLVFPLEYKKDAYTYMYMYILMLNFKLCSFLTTTTKMDVLRPFGH